MDCGEQTTKSAGPATPTRLRSARGFLVAMTLWAGSGLSGCGDSAHGPVVQGPRLQGPAARLTATESRFVPGRIELDGRRSEYVGEGGRIRSHTYTVRDRNTGETVYGPVIETQELQKSLLKVYLPAGAYVARLTVEAEPVATAGGLSTVSSDASAATDTAETDFDLDAAVSFASSDCDATCSSSSSSDQVACTLSSTSGCYSIDLSEVMDDAAALDSDIGEDTTAWIQAWGGSGGDGGTCIFDGGSGGDGGFAQMITTVSDFSSTYGTTTLYYYLGDDGGNGTGDCFDTGTAGTGGASTIVATTDATPEESDLVVLAGGGAGGGYGHWSFDGGDPGNEGNAAISTTSGSKLAKGTTSDGDGNDGQSGIGGMGGGVCSDATGWLNATPTLDGSAGEGGDGDGCQNTGAGGGGYNGGSSGPESYEGGLGGGSYAAASTESDSDAPTGYQSHSGDGEVVITFNTTPG